MIADTACTSRSSERNNARLRRFQTNSSLRRTRAVNDYDKNCRRRRVPVCVPAPPLFIACHCRAIIIPFT